MIKAQLDAENKAYENKREKVELDRKDIE